MLRHCASSSEFVPHHCSVLNEIRSDFASRVETCTCLEVVLPFYPRPAALQQHHMYAGIQSVHQPVSEYDSYTCTSPYGGVWLQVAPVYTRCWALCECRCTGVNLDKPLELKHGRDCEFAA